MIKATISATSLLYIHKIANITMTRRVCLTFVVLFVYTAIVIKLSLLFFFSTLMLLDGANIGVLITLFFISIIFHWFK